MHHFIDVIIPIPLERLFTYRISEKEAHFLQPGMRVAVPFGKRKIYTAVVFKVHNKPPLQYKAKEIEQILDDKPIVTQKQFRLWEWIAQYYMCTLGEVLRAALPSMLLLESETIIQRIEIEEIDEEVLTDDEFLIVEALNHQPLLKVDEVMQILGKKTIMPVLGSLIQKGALNLKEEIYEKYKPKLVRMVRLNPKLNSEESLKPVFESLKRAPRQTELLMGFFQLKAELGEKPISSSRLLNYSGTTTSQLAQLIKKNILEDYNLATDRVSFKNSENNEEVILNEYQIKALDSINHSFEIQDVTLLHGITSSGKTELYIKMIKHQLEKDHQVLYLLPEIALTTQLLERLKAHFGNKIAVFHSKYSMAERVEVIHRVLAGSEKAKVILGARSAVLLPFKDLGLVIVDEEHEPSFKQFDPAPRYHARDVAIMLGKQFNAKVLLGSATPSLETYHNAVNLNKYGLVELNQRYNEVIPPKIELVDLKDAFRRKRMTGHFSKKLIEEMTEVLQENKQIILFQNRRGFAPIVQCNSCGHSPQCPNCDVSLTYHKFKNQLRCHYCSHSIPMINQCLACGSIELDNKGFGTEQIEQEAKVLFPEKTVGRMDLDTTRGKYAYEKIIQSFENGEIDILVGTQMLSKGLDFRNLKLVGIMHADSMLNFPDFRAHERSFQLMQQVSGRAGRTDERGKVLIQTYNPFHKILQQVSEHNYKSMFEEQLEERYQYKYPPYYRLIKITLRHRDFNKINEGADWFSRSLKQVFKQNVLGPEFPPVARIRNQYNKNILVKIPPGQSLNKTKEAINKIKNSFLSVKEFRPIRVILNVDNY